MIKATSLVVTKEQNIVIYLRIILLRIGKTKIIYFNSINSNYFKQHFIWKRKLKLSYTCKIIKLHLIYFF